MNPNVRPRIFIASSVQSLSIAYSVQLHLKHDAKSTIWTDGVFQPSDSTLESLIKALEKFDFAIFVVGMDDVTQIKGKEVRTTRDNVIFELGLFMGKLGKSRCFILAPQGQEDFHLPTDLLGVTPVNYEHDNEDDDYLHSALGAPCHEIRMSIKRLGFIYRQATLLPTKFENSNRPESVLPTDPLIRTKTPLLPATRQIRSIDILVNENILKEGDRLHLVKSPRSNLRITDDNAKNATFIGNQLVRWDYDGNAYSLSSLCEVICMEFGGMTKAGPFQGTNFWAIEGENTTLAERARSIARRVNSEN